VVLRSLEEDCGRRPDGTYVFGDVTSDGAIPADRLARARLVAKSHGVLAGLDVFARVFTLCDPEVQIERLARDGDPIAPKAELLRVRGRARALLVAERTALNFVQRMSGVASLTADYVARTGGRARVLDTRKTTPGLRVFEKYAVRCGGGENHRFGLYDEAMVKNNHLDLAGKDLSQVLRGLREKLGDGFVITAEARDEDEALAAVAGGADIVLLDNLSVARMEALCPRMRAAAGVRRLEIEASGGITLANIDAVASSGVDRISIGALTHSAPALDLSLYLEPGA
jgi:nicotinate-nucleotide pyrophosphorylase (carboxylating)